MSYIKLICPSCQNKHEVSKFYIKENNILSLEELIKQICTCYNIIDTHDYSDENKSDFIDESIFKKKAFIQLNKKTTLKNNQKVYSVYNYVPESRLNFKYDNEFNNAVIKAKNFFQNSWNKRELLLRFKCQKDLRNSNFWNENFKFVEDHNEDHDNSYLIIQALKNRKSEYIRFLSIALNSVLKNKEIILCKIPSSTKNKINGCDDLIKYICSLNSNFINASDNIKRIKDILPAHRGGRRDVELHLATSEIINKDIFNNKDILLIDDLITTGTSAAAFTKLIMNKTRPKSLNTLIFGKTISKWN